MVQDCSLGRWLAEAALTRHWCDVTLQASGREYRAHRVVLSCASPFIRRLLLSRPNEDVPTTIVLADFSSETVEALLQYVYSGEVRLAPDHIGGFIALATALQVHIDQKHLDGLQHSYQEIMKNSSSKKYELISTDFLTTADAISDNSAKKDNFMNCEMGNNDYHIKCPSPSKEMDYCDIKSEIGQKNMDVEVLIKSDKIPKSSAIILPQVSDSVSVGQTQGCDDITFQKYRNCFLKNILVSEGRLYGRNGAYEDVKLAKEKKMKLFDESPLSREGSCKSDQAFTNHRNSFNNNQSEDNYSNSSCEILDDSNEEKCGTKPGQLFPSKYPAHVRNYHEDLNYYCNNFAVKSNIGTENCPPLDLVNNQRNVSKKLSTNLSVNLSASCKVPWSGLQIEKTPCNILNQGRCLRNDKLVRPIPSLMPIQGIQSGADFRKVRELHNESPAILDLTTARSVHLVRNSKSAFDEVNYKWTGTINDPTSLVIASDDLSRNQSNYLHNQKSLRLGFSFTERARNGDCCVPDKSKNFTKNSVKSANTMNCSNSSGVFKQRKIILHNKVLASPWSGRCPVYYRREEKRKESIDFQANIQNADYNPTSMCYAPESTVKSTVSGEISPGLSIQRYHADRLNDSNNNFGISNTNAQQINCNDYETESISEHTSMSEALHHTVESHFTNIHRPKKMKKTIQLCETGDFELTKILNGTKSDTAMPPAKSPGEQSNVSPTSNESFPNDELILTAVKIESPIFSEDACALKCEVCLKMFTSRATLALHASTHEARARYKCEQCDKCFSQLRNYKYHVSVHKGTKEFAATCNVCGKYFNDRGYLSSHMKIHRNRKEYQCPHCPKSFNQRVAYNMHVRIHTGVKPHQCEACGKAFSRKMLLKQHARTHSGEKPYSCAACGKRFADRSNMTLHMRLHSGVKPFSCTLCPKSFTKKHHLKTHLNYHTGNKPYSCCKCGLTFSQSSNMRTHMKKCVAPNPGEKLLANGQEVDIGQISASL